MKTNLHTNRKSFKFYLQVWMQRKVTCPDLVFCLVYKVAKTPAVIFTDGEAGLEITVRIIFQHILCFKYLLRLSFALSSFLGFNHLNQILNNWKKKEKRRQT